MSRIIVSPPSDTGASLRPKGPDNCDFPRSNNRETKYASKMAQARIVGMKYLGTNRGFIVRDTIQAHKGTAKNRKANIRKDTSVADACSCLPRELIVLNTNRIAEI